MWSVERLLSLLTCDLRSVPLSPSPPLRASPSVLAALSVRRQDRRNLAAGPPLPEGTRELQPGPPRGLARPWPVSSAGCPPPSGLPRAQGWSQGTRSSASSLPPLSSRCPPAPRHLCDRVWAPRTLFAAPGKGARHRGRSGCGPVPSLGHSLRESLESPLFPCTATSLACGESLGDPTGPPSRRSCLLSLGSASRHGAHSGWWGPTWGVPVSPPTARAGAGAEQGAGADGPHVPQSPTRNYFLPAPHHAPHSRKHRVFTIRGSAGRRRPSRATDPAGCRVGRSPEAPASEPDAPAAASGCQAR